MKRAAILLILAAPVVLSGCAVAVLPVIAAGAIAKKQRDRAHRNPAKPPKAPKPAKAARRSKTAIPPVVPTIAAPETSVRVDGALPPPALPAANPATDPFIRFALDRAERRAAGQPVASAMLVKNVNLFQPAFMPCDGLPLAVLIDVDDPAGTDAEAISPVVTPALAPGLEKLRDAQVQVIWLSGRLMDARAALAERLNKDGLWVEDKDIVMLSRGGDDRAQQERLDVADGRCVVAMLGDRKTDFDELFDYLHRPDDAFALDRMWAQGWFLATPAAPVARP